MLVCKLIFKRFEFTGIEPKKVWYQKHGLLFIFNPE